MIKIIYKLSLRKLICMFSIVTQLVYECFRLIFELLGLSSTHHLSPKKITYPISTRFASTFMSLPLDFG